MVIFSISSSISPNSAADSPTVVHTSTPESPIIRVLPASKEAANIPSPPHVKPKSITLPARMDPAEVMRVGGGMSNGYVKHPHVNQNPDNLDCIKEFLDDNLASNRQRQLPQEQEPEHESGSRYRRRSRESIIDNNKYQFDESDYLSRSQTLQQ